MIESVRFDDAGLVTAVVQDADDGRVRMVGWMNAEAIERTMETGLAHFWSRSRERLWQKGETSGNVLRVTSIVPDCDSDTLLVTASADGPTCHTGAETCFGDGPGSTFAWLDRLAAIIDARATALPAGSYTASLIESGVDGPARKVLEEAGEVAFAAKDHSVAAASDRPAAVSALVGEAADLMFHLLVLLAERGVAPGRVVDELRRRHSRNDLAGGPVDSDGVPPDRT